MTSDFLLYGATGFVGDAAARMATQSGLAPFSLDEMGTSSDAWRLIWVSSTEFSISMIPRTWTRR